MSLVYYTYCILSSLFGTFFPTFFPVFCTMLIVQPLSLAQLGRLQPYTWYTPYPIPIPMCLLYYSIVCIIMYVMMCYCLLCNVLYCFSLCLFLSVLCKPCALGAVSVRLSAQLLPHHLPTLLLLHTSLLLSCCQMCIHECCHHASLQALYHRRSLLL